jgi:signal transduction histidine kinase
MESVGRLAQPAQVVRRALGKQAGLLVGFALLLAGLVAVFAYVVVHFQNESQSQARNRFAQQATLTAQFTGSLLSTSAGSAVAAAEKAFGGKTVDPRTVDQGAKGSGLMYLIVLDAKGHRLAASTGAPATAAPAGSTQVRNALAGRPWFSNLIGKSAVVEWAQPFTTPYGRRVEVEGFPAGLFGSFLNSFLASSQAGGSGMAFVLDGQNRVIASSAKKVTVGAYPNAAGLVSALERNPQGDYTYSGAQRFYASSVIDGSNWRAVTATTTGSIYPALAGSKSWILYVVLVAFALVGGASVLFFWRALSAGHALRNANDELVGVNATLEGRVADRTAAAEERARELARSNEELEQFSSIASHDLQEPLRKVRMFGDRLRETLGSDISEDAAGDLDRMQNAAERMQRLINDLLEFSRVTHRGNAFEQVELSQVAEEVIADLEARVVELDATIELSELPAIDADRTQMRQLMQNLIANALKFHRPDVAPVVRIQSNVIVGQTPRFAGEAVPSDRCVITVEDNGIGFDEKHAERIFAAFERLHGRSAYEGTGIGLSIARKIAWRHGGQIVATGVPGQGSVFTVILPLTHTPSPNGGEKR